jgi:hypothetical protein
VRVPPSGTWERRRADLYALAEDWVGPEPALSEVDARGQLVRRYLGAFGPAPRPDIAVWAGVRVGVLAAALERLELPRFRDERGRELLDLPRAPLPPAETRAPVRFLPTFDATLLVHARRTGSTWRYEDGRVRLDPFGRLPRGSRAGVEEEAERLAAFHA